MIASLAGLVTFGVSCVLRVPDDERWREKNLLVHMKSIVLKRADGFLRSEQLDSIRESQDVSAYLLRRYWSGDAKCVSPEYALQCISV